MHRAYDDSRVGLVLVGFSPAAPLAAIAGHLDWPGAVLSDPDRLLYARLGLGRAPWWRVYSPRTLLTYARAVATRTPLARPIEDTRQLGGDAVVVDGVVTALWRPRSPDDRPAVGELLAAAAEAVGNGGHDDEEHGT